MSATMKQTSAVTRRPYHGSCHCGNIKYIVYISLPNELAGTLDYDAFCELTGLRIYKCNCTPCHKMGIFHLRPADSPGDFMILTPSDLAPTKGVSNYKCNDEILNWYFCTNCGVRCFTLRGTMEHAEIELPVSVLRPAGVAVEGNDDEMKKVTVIRPQRQGWSEKVRPTTGYVSVNMTSLDPNQEGLDLRDFTENKWIEYYDCLEQTAEDSTERPHVGGLY